MFFAPSKIRKRAKICNMGASKTSDHIQIQIKMQSSSQEPSAPIKASIQNLEFGCIKTCDHIQIMNKIEKSSWETQASSKAPNQDLKDMYVLCTFKFKIEPKFWTWVNQISVTVFKSVSRCKTSVRILQHPQKPQMRT